MPSILHTPRTRGEGRERMHEFRWASMPGAGFSFTVDDEGQPILDNPAAQANWDLCQAGGDDSDQVIDLGIKEHVWSWTNPAVGTCPCGEEVYLDHFTNTCDCGADYDSQGNRLAPREQWGEETGESLGDILRIA